MQHSEKSITRLQSLMQKPLPKVWLKLANALFNLQQHKYIEKFIHRHNSLEEPMFLAADGPLPGPSPVLRTVLPLLSFPDSEQPLVPHYPLQHSLCEDQ